MAQIDWAASMQQTFEFYVVDPNTWADSRKLDTVKNCSIERDLDTETLGSASMDVAEPLGECYIRAYLIAIQNGSKERVPLGTFLVQTPESGFDGKQNTYSLDAYTPLTELKENSPELGYAIPEGSNTMDFAYFLARDNMRAPVVKHPSDKTLSGDFVANSDDTFLSFITALAANAEYNISLDEIGRLIFEPNQETESICPIWIYDDGNSSILHPEITIEKDIYGIPNVIEVVYSTAEGSYKAVARNEDINSPLSVQSRGREIVYRVTNPDMGGFPSQQQLQHYAERTLKELSSVECRIQYTHGYCPVRIGDGVLINYERAGMIGIRAKVVSQSIECSAGCKVTETAVFKSEL